MKPVQRLPRWFQKWMGAYIPPRKSAQEFYLTFDDGPSSITSDLLDLIEGFGYTASFFWLWSKFEEHHTPSIISRLKRGGHTVGIHGLSHISPWRIGRENCISTLNQALNLWERLDVPLVPFYRPPYGHALYWQNVTLTSEKALRLRLVFWDLMPADYLVGVNWVNELINSLRPGDIVVMHERKNNLRLLQNCLTCAFAAGWKATALEAVEAVVSQKA
ncbi:MAG: polysaccharide deacetylase family protein [Bacteroidia bacterium]|nr:polysaccharide deacetylase family protein [Bacteroidia bacterium]MDW8134469.1 polysaccharide deacetylase family protein [Bacteroidia bacterium]